VGVRSLEVDLVVVRRGSEASVLASRCPHRGASLADASIEAGALVCKEHGWDFRLDTGESPSLAGECVHRFETWVDEGQDRVFVDPIELRSVRRELDAELSYRL